jgi:hypothetical protein
MNEKSLMEARSVERAIRSAVQAEMASLSPSDPDIERYAELIGLKRAEPQFRKELVAAVETCLLINAFDRVRRGDVKDALRRLSRNASKVSAGLQETVACFELLRHAGVDLNLAAKKEAPIETDVLAREVKRYQSIAEIARFHTERWPKDKGGGTKMLAFDTLVRQLMVVFKNYTGDDAKVTWDPVEEHYKGDFFAFFRAVLEKVLHSSHLTKRPLQCPKSDNAMGKYIADITRTPRTGRQTRKRKRRLHPAH